MKIKSWALVTGASKRLGKVIATELVNQGYSIILHYHTSSEDASNLKTEFEKSVEVHLWNCDLSNPTQVIAGWQELISLDKIPSVLVHCASIFEGGTLQTTKQALDEQSNEPPAINSADLSQSLSEFHEFQTKLFQVNLMTPVLMDKMYLDYWYSRSSKQISQKPPHILYLLDQRITQATDDKHIYNLSKKALANHFEQMAANHGALTQINAIAPGLILPPPGASIQHLVDRQNTVPLKRHGGPSDIQNATKYLLESSFVHGQILYCDGGEHL